MVSDGYETRNVVSLRTGSKIAILVGLPFLAFAVYNYFVPLWVQGQTGVFGCGSASSPPTSDWAKGVCQGVSDAALYRAIAAGILGLLIPALGVALFGVDKRAERRAVRHDDDDDYADRPARRRGSDVERTSRRFDDADDDDLDRDESRGRRGRRSYEDDDRDEASSLSSAPKYPSAPSSDH